MRQNLVLLVIILVFSCKKKAPQLEDLGVIDFNVTGKEMAIPQFERGLLLLHSFEYIDAREAFQQAQKLDPKMVMAYWGEAMTYNHSLWREQNFEEASNVVEKMKGVRNKIKLTSVEEGLVEAVEILYTKKIPKKERDKAYMKHMSNLYDNYSDNNEIAAFYALSLLGSASGGRNDSIYGAGALIANKVLENNSQHPGALHYLIHSYDDPGHAHLALDAADAYAKVAPDASHALHMPSHIYVALGMWDQVVDSNIDSYQASVKRMEEKELDNNARGYHAFHWLQYGYLQRGEVDKAEKMVWDMKKYCSENPSKRARVHMVFLKGTFLAETGLWNHPIADIELDASGTNIMIIAQNHFIDGMKAYNKKKLEKLNSVISELNTKINKESLLVDNASKGFSLCASADRSIPTRKDVQTAGVMSKQLQALAALLTNDQLKTEALLLESCKLEDALIYSYGPPNIMVPSNELYGQYLTEKNRPEEAVTYFEKALKKGTKRLRALTGLEEARKMLNKNESVSEVVL